MTDPNEREAHLEEINFELFIGKNDYPSIEKVKNLVFKYHQDWSFIIKDDIIRIHSRP